VFAYMKTLFEVKGYLCDEKRHKVVSDASQNGVPGPFLP
jgi:hypothetical protein